MTGNALSVLKLDVAYGPVPAVRGLSLRVEPGEIVGLIGPNGAGKSTTLHAIVGLVRARGGDVLLGERSLRGKSPEAIARSGVALVPEGRRLFPRLTVEENLLLGAYRRSARAAIAKNLEFCFATFPRLAERRRQLAGSMSGGEQQMLTLARALMTAPKILLIDEPSVGLAPILVIHTIDKIRELKESYRLTVLMAEQNFNQAIRIADRGYVIVHGRIEYEGRSREELANNELVHKLYMGL